MSGKVEEERDLKRRREMLNEYNIGFSYLYESFN